MTTATVTLWGTTIGYVSQDPAERFARFEYDPDFVDFGIELAPLQMPVRKRHIYQFQDLHPRSFHGLPGMLADSLPDKYGNRLIDVWLAQTGRKSETFNSVDRLCYTGMRGMGALEFEPALGDETTEDKIVEVAELIKLASMAFASKESLDTRLTSDADQNALLDILSVGTSAGGARAKAVIAYDPETQQVRSGQLNLPKNFEHWLIKFDGVELSGDWGIADPAGYGLLEYSYYLVAMQCDISMMESRLFSENGRNHFMTRRFDRDEAKGKKFVQTLAALAHMDYYESGLYSYEQAIMTLRRLGVTMPAIEEQVRRTIFNLVGCNQDDHVKNISCIMERNGKWDLSPAYDMCHAEGSEFTRFHQLSLNGKTADFSMDDIRHLEQYAGLPRGRGKKILEQVLDAFAGWPKIAQKLDLPETLLKHVQRTQRMTW